MVYRMNKVNPLEKIHIGDPSTAGSGGLLDSASVGESAPESVITVP